MFSCKLACKRKSSWVTTGRRRRRSCCAISGNAISSSRTVPLVDDTQVVLTQPKQRVPHGKEDKTASEQKNELAMTIQNNRRITAGVVWPHSLEMVALRSSGDFQAC